MSRHKEYVVALEEAERQRLETVVVARNSPQGEALRARIVLTCAQYPRSTDAKIGAFVGCSWQTVKTTDQPGASERSPKGRKWRRRWCQTRGIEEAPRSGRPRVFSP